MFQPLLPAAGQSGWYDPCDHPGRHQRQHRQQVAACQTQHDGEGGQQDHRPQAQDHQPGGLQSLQFGGWKW